MLTFDVCPLITFTFCRRIEQSVCIFIFSHIVCSIYHLQEEKNKKTTTTSGLGWNVGKTFC